MSSAAPGVGGARVEADAVWPSDGCGVFCREGWREEASASSVQCSSSPSEAAGAARLRGLLTTGSVATRLAALR